MHFVQFVVVALTAIGVQGQSYRGCGKQESCAQCLNQPGCAYCATDGRGAKRFCAEECGEGALTLRDRQACPAIGCSSCVGSDNVVKVTFEQDDVVVKCVNEVKPRCVDEDHTVGAIRCFNHEQCPKLEELGDKRLLTEGKYRYMKDSCFTKNCDQCLAAEGTCELFSEVVGGKEAIRCMPKGFLEASELITKVDKCPKNLGCGDCKTGFTYSLVYGTSGVQAACVEGCSEVHDLVGATFCYKNNMCDLISDPSLKESGFYPYPENSCFTKDCAACLQASNCAFLSKNNAQGTEAIRGCVPTGFISGDDLQEADECEGGNDSGDKAAQVMLGSFVVMP